MNEQSELTRRVLVVDDSLDSAESLAMLLRLSGDKVETAHDGLAALDAVERFRPDVVLLDLGLPKLDGYEACRRIRARPDGSAMTVIALTGWGQDENRRRAQEVGFDAHVVKPVDHTALLDLLGKLRPQAS
jgi:CheY-like chemotaxis protein